MSQELQLNRKRHREKKFVATTEFFANRQNSVVLAVSGTVMIAVTLS